MKFDEIVYERPDVKVFEEEFLQLLKRFKEAETFKTQDQLVIDIYQHRANFYSMYQLANIRFDLNLKDEFYDAEVAYLDENMPNYSKLTDKFYELLIESKFKNELSEKWGKHLFDLASFSVKGFDPVILDDLKLSNKLATDYTRLRGTAKIEFDGKLFDLVSIGKYLEDKDRDVREAASNAKWSFFAEKQSEFDNLYDEMVKVRHQMAIKMKCENFVELGYNWMKRIDYDEKMIDNFRKQIVDEIVPLIKKLREKQRIRLGYDELKLSDLRFHFYEGNPKPKGEPLVILDNAAKMYADLSKETGEFFEYLLENNLIDIVNRDGKAGKGYCWSIDKYAHPYIFACFNGTAGDINVLTHEAGHAFQFYQNRNIPIEEYRLPTSESAEIHAMAMEFLTYPYMEMFFKEDTDKYFFSHLNSSILMLPYFCAVDHFQHIVYKNPTFTPDERAATWTEMEALYMPEHNLGNIPYLESGRYWQSQSHIFSMPFYYIDYGLAMICALQFWQKSTKDRKEAWKDYLNLCNAGGTKPFLELLKVANVNSPFEDGTIKGIAQDLEKYIDTIDDSKF